MPYALASTPSSDSSSFFLCPSLSFFSSSLSLSSFLFLARIVNGLPLDSGNLKTGRNFWREMEREGEEKRRRDRTARAREREGDRDTYLTRRHVVGVSYWYFIVRSACDLWCCRIVVGTTIVLSHRGVQGPRLPAYRPHLNDVLRRFRN